MLAKYGCIMFAAIVQKHVLGHKFWTIAHRMMILVSRTVFMAKESAGTFHFDDQSVFLFVRLSI